MEPRDVLNLMAGKVLLFPLPSALLRPWEARDLIAPRSILAPCEAYDRPLR